MGHRIRFFSLDEARAEIRSRHADIRLKSEVERNLGRSFIAELSGSARAVLWKAVASPDRTFDFFQACSAYLGIEPLFFEHLGDKFTSVNEEKKNLGRLFLKDGGLNKVYDICNIAENENKEISRTILRNEQGIVDFYRNVFQNSLKFCQVYDLTEWAKKFGKAEEYYYYYLSHFICHGVAFELFIEDEGDLSELRFTTDVVMPAIDKIRSIYGIDPLVVKPYPADQNSDEDFYWWSFDEITNSRLLEFCKNQNFKYKIRSNY